MRAQKLLVIILVAILVGLNIVLLFSNKNNKDIIELYQQEFIKLLEYQNENKLRKMAFDLAVNESNLLSELVLPGSDILNGKQLVFYVPKSSCGLCLEKMLNRYWDDYVSKIANSTVVLFENPNLSNIYYIGEKLIDYQQIKEYGFNYNDLIIIFFLDNNKELISLYLFDINSLESLEPYLRSFSIKLERK